MRRIIRSNTVEKLDKILFVSSNEPGTPFSFFRWLFWNKKIDLQSAEGKQIFRHEIFHIRQKHSLDIVFIEILSAVFWVNPFFYLVKKELKAIHEFLADRFAIKETDPHSYAELLLMQVLDTKIRLINPFFHNQIKRRITMITSNKHTGRQYLEKVAVLPLAALVIAAFAFTYLPESRVIPGNNGIHVADTIPKPHTKKQFIFISRNKLVFETDSLIFPSKNISTLSPDYDKIHVIVNGYTENAAILKNKTLISERITLYTKNDPTAIKLYGKNAENGVIIFEGAQVLDIAPQIFYKDDFAALDKNQKAADIKYKVEDNKVFEKMEIEPSFPGGEIEWKKFLQQNLKINVPVSKGAPNNTYTVWVRLLIDKEGSIKAVIPITNHGFGMEGEVIRVMKLSPKWTPARQNGKIVNAYKMQAVTFLVIRENELSKVHNKETITKDYGNPANWDYQDTAFMNWRRDAIKEIIAIARVEGKAAYYYKGRTYVFARIDQSKPPNTNSYYETDGLQTVFLLNGKLIHSIEEINSRYKRSDIKSLNLIFSSEARAKYNIDAGIPDIQTF